MSHQTPSWFSVGHTTSPIERTGCTVILFDRLVPARVDVRGGAPGTRETSVLDAERLVGHADAIVLTGGSAFGLAAADGVMRLLRERGRGMPTSAGAVPIVPAAVLFDLAVGANRTPSAEDGYAAATRATRLPVDMGIVGAGTGATVAKLGGTPGGDGGLGVASSDAGSTTVTAIVVLNAVGDIVDPGTSRPLVTSVDPSGYNRSGREMLRLSQASGLEGENTTIGAILIDGGVDGRLLQRACIAAHDALARCVVPAHTIFDGDTFFAVGELLADVPPQRTAAICAAVEIAIEQAIVGLFAGMPRAAEGEATAASPD